MIRIVFVVFLFSFVTSDSPPITKCESKIGNVSRTNVTNCKINGGRYILKRGTKAGIEIDFEIFRDVQKVTAAARGIIGGIPIPYPLPNSNGCSADLKCPLAKGGPYKYSTALFVQPFYPPIVVDVEWTLKDENQNTFACIIIPARIE